MFVDHSSIPSHNIGVTSNCERTDIMTIPVGQGVIEGLIARKKTNSIKIYILINIL
jgi:hypothetical protein